MKRLFYIFVSVAFVAIAWGCEKQPAQPKSPQLLDIEVGVSATRAGLTTDNITEVGVTVASSSASLTNERLAKSGATWAFDNAPLMWPAGTVFEVRAYAPYNPTSEEIFVKQDQSILTFLLASDIVAAKATGVNIDDHTVGANTFGTTQWDGTKLKMELQRMTSKLVFNIAYKEALATSLPTNQRLTVGIPDDWGTDEVTLIEMKFNPVDFTSTYGTYAAYTAYAGGINNETKVQTFEVIVPPMQEVAENSSTTTVVKLWFSFAFANQPYSFEKVVRGLNLTRGKQYTISLTCTQYGLEVGTVELTDWEDGGTTDNVDMGDHTLL